MSADMKYQATINLAEKNNSHTLAYDMVQAHAQGRVLCVLEVGCASGYWGAMLKHAGHAVIGVEPDPQSAIFAEKVLDQVFVGVVEDYFAAYPESSFDVISFVDVLEHTMHPEAVLAQCRVRLKAGGVVIASIPNIAHLAVRSMLLSGRWVYAQTGIMDNSHVRFFTRDTIVELFGSAAFRILDFKPTTMSAANVVNNYGMPSPLLLRVIACMLASDCGWRDFQYVVCAAVAEKDPTQLAENRRFLEPPGFWRAIAFKARTLAQMMVLELKLKLSGRGRT